MTPSRGGRGGGGEIQSHSIKSTLALSVQTLLTYTRESRQKRDTKFLRHGPIYYVPNKKNFFSSRTLELKREDSKHHKKLFFWPPWAGARLPPFSLSPSLTNSAVMNVIWLFPIELILSSNLYVLYSFTLFHPTTVSPLPPPPPPLRYPKFKNHEDFFFLYTIQSLGSVIQNIFRLGLPGRKVF